MKIDFTQVMKDLEGKLLPMNKDEEEKGKKGKPLTLRAMCITALSQPVQSRDGNEKFKRGMMNIKIHDNDKIELEAEEIVFIKDVVGAELANPIDVTNAWLALDPSSKVKW